jgi:hypothetical protein
MRRWLTVISVFALAVVSVAALSTNYETDPVEIDNGGEIAASSNYEGLASIGGTVIGTLASSNYIHDAAYIPMLETGGVTVPQLSLNLGPQTPGSSVEGASAQGVGVMQLMLTAGALGNVTVTSLRITASGTGNDQNHISNVNLYRDFDGDGLYNGAVDIQIAQSGSGFPSDDGEITFTMTEVITVSTSVQWLLTYDFSGSAVGNETFACSIMADSHVTAVDAISDPVGVTGAPVTGATVTIAAPGTPGSVSLSRGVNNLPGGQMVGYDETVGVFQFRVKASSIEDVTLEKVTLSATGTGNDLLGIAQATLYVDVNNDGLQDASDVAVSTAQTYGADNGTLTFDSISRSIGYSSQETYLVVYELAGTAVEGHTFGVSIARDSAVTGRGNTSGLLVSVSGAPVGSMIEIGPVPPQPYQIKKTSGGCAPAGDSQGSPLAVLPLVLFALAVLVLRRARRYGTLRR